MSRVRNFSGLAAGIVLVAVYAFYSLGTLETTGVSSEGELEKNNQPSTSSRPRMLGVASCAASACHGYVNSQLNLNPLQDLADPDGCASW